MFAINEKGNYIFVSFTNTYTPLWLSCLHGLVLSHLLFKPSDCRKANKSWGCVEKVAEAKLSI